MKNETFKTKNRVQKCSGKRKKKGGGDEYRMKIMIFHGKLKIRSKFSVYFQKQNKKKRKVYYQPPLLNYLKKE